jgi:hypothetical protein
LYPFIVVIGLVLLACQNQALEKRVEKQESSMAALTGITLPEERAPPIKPLPSGVNNGLKHRNDGSIGTTTNLSGLGKKPSALRRTSTTDSMRHLQQEFSPPPCVEQLQEFLPFPSVGGSPNTGSGNGLLGYGPEAGGNFTVPVEGSPNAGSYNNSGAELQEFLPFPIVGGSPNAGSYGYDFSSGNYLLGYGQEAGGNFTVPVDSLETLTAKVKALLRAGAKAGPTGATGPQGQAGAQGEAGSDGAQGEAGSDGAQGEAGSDGLAGTAGSDGDQGETGPAGKDGLHGKDGSDGLAGTAGSDGDQGETGPAGKDGLHGKDGSDGLAGTAGSDGDQGETGPAGAGFDDSRFTKFQESVKVLEQNLSEKLHVLDDYLQCVAEQSNTEATCS